jgi:hypothetical protein
MKMTLALSTLLLSVGVFAQTAAVKDIPADGDTTISVSKGKNTQPNYEVTNGTDEISGDPQILSKDARESWKQACTDWKKEMRENNKDNQIISLSCGTPKCDKKDATEITCTSTATSKIKTKIRD